MKAIITKLNEIKEKLILPENRYSDFDKTLFKTLLERATALIIRQYGKDSPYLERLSQFDKESWYSINHDDIQQMHGLIDIIIDDIELDEKKEEIVNRPIQIEQNVKRIASEINTLNNKVFIVHGHNESMKQSVARIVEKLELTPIILHEQSNLGNTVIEKFMTHSNVGFAIVLLSADDFGYSKNEGAENTKKRARQNVILELGFLLES